MRAYTVVALAVTVSCLLASPGPSGAAQEEGWVEAREEPLTMPYDMLVPLDHPLPSFKPEPPAASSPAVPPSGPPPEATANVSATAPAKPARPQAAPKRLGELTFPSIVLENAYVRVRVIPEIGGVLESAQFKPTNDEFFMRERRYKQWWPWWESGTKLSFPFAEHGCVLLEQPASWRVYRHEDGRVTVAMWMEFSRWNANEYPPWPVRGRDKVAEPSSIPWKGHTTQLVSQHVTLHPRRAAVSVTYRLVNPAPYRQGRRLWCTAFLPRYHTAAGPVLDGGAVPQRPTDAELIFPTKYVSTHSGAAFGTVDTLDLRNWAGLPGAGYSWFSWNMPSGFCGIWYPQARVNRIRLNPPSAPGTKFWFEGYAPYDPTPTRFRSNVSNGVELWGSFDNLFEAAEQWNEPGEAEQFTHEWVLVSGIGKVQFANAEVAFGAEPGEAGRLRLGIVPLVPARVLEVRWNGKALGEPRAAAPDCPAWQDLSEAKGRLEISCDGRPVYAGEYPPPVADDTSGHERIRTALNGPYSREMAANGKGYSGVGLKDLRYPDGTTDQGRILYRLGRLDEAEKCLRTATAKDAADGEGWHLLGMCLLEAGNVAEAKACLDTALKAGRVYPAAGYWRAVIAIGESRQPDAGKYLDDLLTARPFHWEARLLRAWLLTAKPETREDALRRARALVDEDPADPRASRVLLQALYLTNSQGTREREALCEWQACHRLCAEPGAQRRMNEFLAATQGRFRPAVRIGLPGAKP